MVSSAKQAPVVLSDTINRYLETIYYIEHEGEAARPSQLAEWLEVKAPTVTGMLRRLQRDGLIESASDRSVRLTHAGNEAAALIVRRHRIVERWLTDVLNLDWATADHEASTMAHGISANVVDRLDAQLDYPKTCPHGNLVPGRKFEKKDRLIRLDKAPIGKASMIARISEVAEHQAPQLLGFLHQMGMVPGTIVVLLRNDEQGLEVRVDNKKRFEMAGDIAAAVWVVA